MFRSLNHSPRKYPTFHPSCQFFHNTTWVMRFFLFLFTASHLSLSEFLYSYSRAPCSHTFHAANIFGNVTFLQRFMIVFLFFFFLTWYQWKSDMSPSRKCRWLFTSDPSLLRGHAEGCFWCWVLARSFTSKLDIKTLWWTGNSAQRDYSYDNWCPVKQLYWMVLTPQFSGDDELCKLRRICIPFLHP